MENSTIEQLGVNAVTTYLCTSGYISPQIDKNDKTPMWDGFIYVYKNLDQLNNDNFSYRVPVQVKASEQKDNTFPSKTSYSVPIINLNSYLNDGGVVFFKVLVKRDVSEIYVSFLTKEKIEKILYGHKAQKCVTIDLEKVPNNVDELMANLRRIYLQRKHPLIDLSDLKNRKNYQITFPLKKPTEEVDLLAYLTLHPVDMLLSIDDIPSQFFVKDGPVQLKIKTVSHSEISIEGKTYYHEYRKEYDDKGIRIFVGKCCIISIVDQKKGKSVKFSFTFNSSTIEENISELEFLLAVKEHKYICFDSFKIDFNAFEKKDNVSDIWENAIQFWRDVKNLFQILHLPLDVDFKNISTQDERDLSILINALLYNKTIKCQIKEPCFYDFIIKDLIIRVVALKIDDNAMRLCDINSLEASYNDGDNKCRVLPIHSAIFEMNELPSNIHLSNIVDIYKRFEKKNNEVVLRANIDLYNMLNHYDKKPDEKLLNAAFELSKWLKNRKTNKIPNATALVLNYLQTIKRMGKGYSHYEKRLLYGIVPKDDSERCACCLLNDDIEGAIKYFRQLPKKVQDEFKKTPIYHFMNQ